MKRNLKLLVALLALIMALSLTACGEEEEAASSADCWADQYVAMIESGECRDFADFESMKAELDAIRVESGATYVYALSPGTDGVPTLDGKTDEGAAFLITVDGSEDPDDWAVNYGWEVQFTEAWNGEAAAARSAWDDSDELQCWSSFAPVYDANGNVVCILGIDYPCTDVIADYPEWNRDAEEWNGFEDEITGEIPEAIQQVIDAQVAMADKYAKQLSHK